LTARRSFAVVTGVGVGECRQATKVAREFDRFFLAQVHERRVNGHVTFHSQSQGMLECGDCVFPAVRIAAVVRLGDASNNVLNTPLIGKGRSIGQEDQVTTRDERVRQPGIGINVTPHLYIRISQSIAAQRGESVDRQAGIAHTGKLGNPGGAFELYVMPLTVVERHRIDSASTISVESPVQTRCGVLAARQDH